MARSRVNLTFTFTFICCPQSLTVCFARDLKTNSDFSLYSINFSIAEMESDYCAVLIGSLYKTDYVSSLKGQ